jgi:hypothetical protein
MNGFLKHYARPAFLLCVAVLALAASGMSLIQSYFKLWLEKEPIGLKKSLDDLDESRLGPFTVKEKIKIQSNDIVDSLGTEDYLQWVLVDNEADPQNSASSLMLFITYYGKADSVPHVPEECYTGGGFRKKSSDPITFEVAGVADDERGSGRKIPGRYVIFARSGSSVRSSGLSFPVLYLFNVNCTYASTRNDARFILGRNIHGKHSYFSKVEMVFNQVRNPPDRASATTTCEKLLSVLLPVLEQDHWPDVNDLKGR